MGLDNVNSTQTTSKENTDSKEPKSVSTSKYASPKPKPRLRRSASGRLLEFGQLENKIIELQRRAENPISPQPSPNGILVFWLIFAVYLLQNAVLYAAVPDKYEYIFRIRPSTIIALFAPKRILSMFGPNFFSEYLRTFLPMGIFNFLIYFPRIFYEARYIKRWQLKLTYFMYQGSMLILYGLNFYLNTSEYSVMVGVVFSLFLIMSMLKIHSYIFSAPKIDEKLPVKPLRLSFGHYLTFLYSPILVFEHEYPRKEKRDWGAIISSFLIGSSSWILMNIVFSLFIYPVLIESDKILPWETITEHTRLVLPVIVMWWLMYFLTFRGFIMTIAELYKFKRTKFYSDWWNCRNIKSFWGRWNISFHEFAKVHVFRFLLEGPFSMDLAMAFIFIWSGVLHEMLLDYAFGVPGFLYLMAFVMQIVFIWLQSYIFPKILRSGNGGSAIAWLNLFIGLPGLSIVYSRLSSRLK